MTNKDIGDNNEFSDLADDPLQQHNSLGDIVFGKHYGRFLTKVKEQAPGLWPLVKHFEERIDQLLQETGGKR